MALPSKKVMESLAKEANEWLGKFLSDANTVVTYGESQDRLKIFDAPDAVITRQTD